MHIVAIPLDNVIILNKNTHTFIINSQTSYAGGTH